MTSDDASTWFEVHPNGAPPPWGMEERHGTPSAANLDACAILNCTRDLPFVDVVEAGDGVATRLLQRIYR